MRLCRLIVVCLCLGVPAALLVGCGGGSSRVDTGRGNAIVYTRTVGGAQQTWMMDMDGSNPVVLAAVVGGRDTSSSWMRTEVTR